MAKVDFYPLAHDGLAIEDLSDADRGVFVKERDNDAPEGFKWRPGMDWCRGVDEVFDALEVVWSKYLSVLEVGDEEGVGRWGWLNEGRYRREINGHL